VVLIVAQKPLAQSFTKITTGAIVNDGGNSFGCSWGDYDTDGDLDLFVTNGGSQSNFLYRNNGNGSFTKVTAGVIVNDGGDSRGSSWGDYDKDGDLDLFVANAVVQSNFLYRNDGNGSFTKITSGTVVNDGGNSFGCSWGDYDNDGDLDLFVANGGGQSNFLYRNDGNGSFTKITSGTIANDGGDSQGCAWADYDNDGDIDLFVANAIVQSNFLYRNDGNGSFTKITSGTIVNDGGNSFGCSWGDYDNDGDLDLFVTNGGNQSNFLYRNDGNGSFTKITSGTIVNDGGDSRGSSWGDYDNDGDLDLFVANDIQSNFLYRNDGNGSFTKITSGTIVNDGGTSQGCAWADYDNDGDLDLFVANADGQSNFLYSNNGNTNRWLIIKCVGKVSNTSAIGAKVKVRATVNGTSRLQIREIAAQTGYLSQNSLNAEFGLGNAATVDSLKIEWPSGKKQVFTRVATNQFLVISEDTPTGIEHEPSRPPGDYSLEQNYPNPLRASAFNPSTTIQYALPKAGYVTLKVYNLAGNEIETLVSEKQPAGEHEIRWNAVGLPSGVYFYRIQAGEFIAFRKLLLLQ
jgi:hypothetical protein